MRKKRTALFIAGCLLTGTLAVPAWGSVAAGPGTALPADKDELLLARPSSGTDRDEVKKPGDAGGGLQEKTDGNPEAASSSGTETEVLAADGTRHTLKGVSTDLYIVLPEELYTMDLYFADGVMDLPYMNLEDFASLLCLVYNDFAGDEGYALTFEADQDLATLTRENGYTALFDFSAPSIRFEDFDSFIISSGELFLVDLLSETEVAEDGDTVYERLAVGDFDRFGSELELPLGEYGIQLYRDEKQGACYVPVQTLMDFLLSPSLGLSLRYNGDAAFLVFSGSIGTSYSGYTELGELYHKNKKVKKRSRELAAYSYAELCLALDHLYGLKEIHQIDDFDTLFENTGLKDAMLGRDPVEADKALSFLIDYYLDDLHSGFLDPSSLCGEKEPDAEPGLSYLLNDEAGSLFTDARKEFYGNEVPPYEEIGNTAYITFDSFDAEHSSSELYKLYEEGDEEDEEAEDIRKLVIEAHQAIYREDSPIENVVLDLSCNSGGAVDAAVFVLSWFLGDAPITVQDTLTDAISSSIYRADINLDHEFDAYDSLGDKRLFCLISPCSFSCANLIPAVCKESHMVTLIGQRSGGGSCIVLPLCTAYGSQFRVSGCYRVSTLKNGSVYDVDLGVEPDVYISLPDHLYDREYLTDYINQLP